MVYTRAGCENVHSKWKDLLQTKKISPNFTDPCESILDAGPRFLSEVDLKISPVDLVLDLAATMPFLTMLSKLTEIQFPAQNKIYTKPIVQKEVIGLEINNNNLPLVYLKLMGLRMFIVANKETLENSQDSLLLTCDSFR